MRKLTLILSAAAFLLPVAWAGVTPAFGATPPPKAASTDALPARPAVPPTLLAATVKPKAVPPGKPFKITFHWRAVPLDRDYSVFVHFIGEDGRTLAQDDHQPPVPTSKWSGTVSYTRTEDLPATIPAGTYKIVAGLYTALPDNGGWYNLPLNMGKGVTEIETGRYQAGTVRFDPDAPPPPLDSAGPVTLNLKGYKRTFSEEFDTLSVSPTGPGTRWIAHTPYFGDFGDARFTDPSDGFPFTVKDGILRIEARKGADGWRSGLLASVDPKGNGFSQTYGYFEMRAKFPQGPGTWPAFWMASVEKLKDPRKTGMEFDVIEQYGHAPQSFFATWHRWYDPATKGHDAAGDHFIVTDMSADFHRYGFLWDKDKMVWYFDGVELWRQPTPPQAHSPMYLMVNLALGGGWPIDRTPNPSYLYVDYVRAYQKAGSRG